MASAKILTHLLRQDNISYKTRPVSSMLHIKDAAMEIEDMDIRSVILINCGAVLQLMLFMTCYRCSSVSLFVFTDS